MLYKKFKYLIDRVLSFFLLIIVVPFLIILSLILLMFSPLSFKQILFVQERAGLQGEVFKVYKIRTMNGDKVFPVGGLLRVSGLDELPQLFNVLAGQMSFIGPRPLLPSYTDKYSDFERKRLEVKPGIFGLVQVSGGKTLDWAKRMALDVQYVNEISPYLDFKIWMKVFWIYLSFKKFREKDIIDKFV